MMSKKRIRQTAVGAKGAQVRITRPMKLMGSGLYVDLHQPKKKQISFRDINRTLANTFRHGGQAIHPVSVAQHIVLGASVIDKDDTELIKYWLLHDMHEAYTGDLPTPVKYAFRLTADDYDVCAALELKLDEIIYGIAGVTLMCRRMKARVKEIDNAVCAFEVEQYVRKPGESYGLGKMIDVTFADIHNGPPDGHVENAEYERWRLKWYGRQFDALVARYLPSLHGHR